MDKENKVLELKENSNMIDEASIAQYMKNNKLGTLKRGHVKMYTDNGECILEQDNLIVLRGRTFTLEKIFDCPSQDFIDPSYKTDNLANRKVGLFMVGDDGCQEGSPFVIKPDILSNTKSLGNPIPFRLKEEEGFAGEEQYALIQEYQEGMSATEEIEVEDVDAEGNTVVRKELLEIKPKAYYAKKFKILKWGKSELDKEKGIDIEDEVYIKLELKIESEDFRTIKDYDANGDLITKRATSISELGLCITDDKYSDESIELFSKINFPSEPMSNSSKTLTIHYYIYA